MMKKHYEPPKARISVIKTEDVIMASTLYTESLASVDLGVKEIDIEVFK